MIPFFGASGIFGQKTPPLKKTNTLQHTTAIHPKSFNMVHLNMMGFSNPESPFLRAENVQVNHVKLQGFFVGGFK